MGEDEADWPETETHDAGRSSPFVVDDEGKSPLIRSSNLKDDREPSERTLLETCYAPGYLPSIGFNDLGIAIFKHVNCFQLTPYGRFKVPPTLTVLKQHAKALCLLLHLLQPSPPGIGPYSWPKEIFQAPFEWLHNLEGRYTTEEVPEEEWEDELDYLVNKVELDEPNIKCLAPAELIRDANIVLTTLHFAIQPKHSSLLSLNLGSPRKYPVLAEWISFTNELRNRVAAFKEEVRFLTETLISEAVVPTARRRESHQAGAPESYNIDYPTDRYVLAGLSEGLWNRLTEELKGKEMDEWWDRKEELTARQGIPKFDLVDDSDDDDDNKPRVTWIETTSRLYTIKGMEQHIFVIPGFGEEHGNMTLHREQEKWLPAELELELERLNARIGELAREESTLRENIGKRGPLEDMARG